MYKKIAQIVGLVTVCLLAIMALGFSAYGLVQSTSVMKTLNYQAGYQQAINDIAANYTCQAKQVAQPIEQPVTPIENE